MDEPTPTDLPARVAELERRLKELRGHVERLERVLAVREENPSDRAVVQRREAFDWQR